MPLYPQKVNARCDDASAPWSFKFQVSSTTWLGLSVEICYWNPQRSQIGKRKNKLPFNLGAASLWLVVMSQSHGLNLSIWHYFLTSAKLYSGYTFSYRELYYIFRFVKCTPFAQPIQQNDWIPGSGPFMTESASFMTFSFCLLRNNSSTRDTFITPQVNKT